MTTYEVSSKGLSDIYSFRADVLPQSFKKIVFLKGSFYEMGVQYGKQTGDLIRRNACAVFCEALDFNDEKEVLSKLPLYINYVKEKTPEIFEFWEGIAAGAEVELEKVALINYEIPLVCESSTCSGIAAWGDATVDGRMIVGGNVDSMIFCNLFGVTIIAYPEKGNAFVTAPAAAGHIASGMVLNEKGLVGTLAGGQHSRDIDKVIPAYDPIGAMACVMLNNDRLDTVKQYVDEIGIWGGLSTIYADIENAYVHERTAAIENIRTAGDYGEKDYLIIANHYVSENMQVAHYDEQEINSYTRYATEEKLLNDNHGDITEETVMDILGSYSLLDGNVWKEYAWPADGDEEGGMKTPNMRDPFCQTCITECAIPEKKEFLVRSGPADTYTSSIPDGYGTYYTVKLDNTPEKTVEASKDKAFNIVWQAGKKLLEINYKEGYFINELSKSKKLLHVGMNYENKARCIKSDEDKLLCLNNAINSYAEAELIGRRILQIS